MADIPTNAASIGVSDTASNVSNSATAPDIPGGFVGWDFGIVGDLLGIGSAMDRYNTQAWNRYNAARQAYEYERNIELENTAVQRRMADLKAAGVNPLLAFGSGGGTGMSAQSMSGTSQSVNNRYHSSNSAGALSGFSSIIKAISRATGSAVGEIIGETAPEWFLALG